MPRPHPDIIKKAEREVISIACAEERHEACRGNVLKARGFWKCQCQCHHHQVEEPPAAA